MKSVTIHRKFIIGSVLFRFACAVFSMASLVSCQSSVGTLQKQNAMDLNDIANIKADYSRKASMAHSELSAQRYKQATQKFLQLNQEFPSLAEPLANLGLISFVRKDLKAAKAYLQEALEKEQSIAQVYNLLGLIALNERDIDSAEKYLVNAIRLDESYSNAHYNLALLYEIYLQDMNKAAIHYQKYLNNIEHKDELTSDWLSGIEAVIQQAG